MMANRLYELHRLLKPTGSFYLHCDLWPGVIFIRIGFHEHMPVSSSNTTTHVDSTIKRAGDTTFVTIVTRKELSPEIGAVDQVREYLAILIWPLALLLIAYWLKSRLTELEGFGAKAKFGKIIEEASEDLMELDSNLDS